MKIPHELHQIYYEHKETHEIVIPDLTKPYDEVPTGPDWMQVSRFACQLTTNYLDCGKSGDQIMTANSTWDPGLVTAMVLGGVQLDRAIMIVALACGRCQNVLSHRFAVRNQTSLEIDGYPEGSEEWKKSNTVCEFCETETCHRCAELLVMTDQSNPGYGAMEQAIKRGEHPFEACQHNLTDPDATGVTDPDGQPA